MPSLVNGLGGVAGFGEGFIPRNDDGSSAAIDITSVFGPGGINFFGVNYTTLYVNNNGNITFGGPLSQYIAAPIGGGGLVRPIIAAYWFDVDTRGGVDNASPGGTSTGSDLVYYDLDPGNRIFTATWDDVGYYSNHIGSPNAFQIQLIDMGGGDFDIVFTYEAINQSTSDTNNDPGEAPRAGYSAGNGTGVEIAGSGDYATALLLDTTPGNTGEVGVWRFQVRGGQVMGGGGGGGGGGTPDEPPHDVSFGLDYMPLLHEGDSGVTPFDITITRAGDLTGPSVVHWEIITLSADAADFAPGQPMSGDVVFGVGQTRITVPISVAGDRVFEGDDTFRFVLTQATHGDDVFDPHVSVMDIIVNDDPATTFAFAGPVLRPEGQVGTTPFEFVVIRSGDLSQASEVQWRLEPGTADAADLADAQPLSGVVTFAPGAAQALISVSVRGDTRLEPDEDFTLRLTSVRTGGNATQLNIATTGVILDDDGRQTLLATGSGPVVQPEGDSGATAFTFSVFRVGDLSQPASVPWSVVFPDGGASASDLQGPLGGVVSFAAGAESATLMVLAAGDTRPEPNEIFQVTVGGGIYNTQILTGVILNDDKVAAAATGAGLSAPAPGFDGASTFLQQLAGGGLWSDAGIL